MTDEDDEEFDDDDDEELPETPPDVVATLGFDPAEEFSKTEDAAEFNPADHPHSSKTGQFIKKGASEAGETKPAEKKAPSEKQLAHWAKLKECGHSLKGKKIEAPTEKQLANWEKLKNLAITHTEAHAKAGPETAPPAEIATQDGAPEPEEHEIINLDADIENADWIKQSLDVDIPPIGSDEFDVWLAAKGTKLGDFMANPLYQNLLLNQAMNEVPDDEE